MAWMLQPKSFYQAMRPNFYTVAYRRSGAYKGMGSLGQTDSTADTTGDTTGEGTTTGGLCPGSPGCPGYVTPSQNLRMLGFQPTSSTPSWLVPALAVGLVVFVLMGRGRR